MSSHTTLRAGRRLPQSLLCLLLLATGAWPVTGHGQQAGAQMQRIPQFDNERASSWRSVLPPHTESTLHRHDRYRTVIAIVGGDLKTVSASGETTVSHYETGHAYWLAPMPPGAMHKDVNDTDKPIEVVVVEIK